MPCCEISDCAQMSKTIIAVRHFGLGGRESLETAVTVTKNCFHFVQVVYQIPSCFAMGLPSFGGIHVLTQTNH